MIHTCRSLDLITRPFTDVEFVNTEAFLAINEIGIIVNQNVVSKASVVRNDASSATLLLDLKDGTFVEEKLILTTQDIVVH